MCFLSFGGKPPRKLVVHAKNSGDKNYISVSKRTQKPDTSFSISACRHNLIEVRAVGR